MKILIIEKDIKFAQNNMIPKLLEWFDSFKQKYQIEGDLNFELINGSIEYDNKHYLLYDNGLLKKIKEEYDANTNIGIILGTTISKNGIENSNKQYYPKDDLAEEITNNYIDWIPIFYTTDSAYFAASCIYSFGRDLSSQFLTKKTYTDSLTEYIYIREKLKKCFCILLLEIKKFWKHQINYLQLK